MSLRVDYSGVVGISCVYKAVSLLVLHPSQFIEILKVKTAPS